MSVFESYQYAAFLPDVWDPMAASACVAGSPGDGPPATALTASRSGMVTYGTAAVSMSMGRVDGFAAANLLPAGMSAASGTRIRWREDEVEDEAPGRPGDRGTRGSSSGPPPKVAEPGREVGPAMSRRLMSVSVVAAKPRGPAARMARTRRRRRVSQCGSAAGSPAASSSRGRLGLAGQS